MFMLGNQPLPITSSVRNWANGQGSQIVHSLGQALQLPSDGQYFSEGSDEAVSLRLEWHTIAVWLVLLFHLLFLFLFSF